MENKDNSKEEQKEEIPKKEIENEQKKEEINKSSSKIEIKKPIMSEAEYQNMIKKRNIMKKNARFKPIKLLFGKQKQSLNLNHTITNTSPNINNTNIQINNYWIINIYS